MKNLLVRLGPKAPRYYVQIMAFILIVTYMITPALAVEDMWTAANRIIVDVYNKIAGISTVLAGLMSAVAVIGAKVSNNQHVFVCLSVVSHKIMPFLFKGNHVSVHKSFLIFRSFS